VRHRLSDRLQNRHALHVRRHRKGVGLSGSRKDPGRRPFLGRLTCVRGHRASNERHDQQPIPPFRAWHADKTTPLHKCALVHPGHGSRIAPRTTSPASIHPGRRPFRHRRPRPPTAGRQSRPGVRGAPHPFGLRPQLRTCLRPTV
jgi:hypothetical protein